MRQEKEQSVAANQASAKSRIPEAKNDVGEDQSNFRVLLSIAVPRRRSYVTYSHRPTYSLLFLLVLLIACNGQVATRPAENGTRTTETEVQSDEEPTKKKTSSTSRPHDSDVGSNKGRIPDSASQPGETLAPPSHPLDADPALQLSRFVRRIFQDKDGNLWFGTNGDGVIRYDGDALEYFSIIEGFGGVAVRGIVEDQEGNVWFGTERGLTKYDGQSFTNFTEKDGLINNDVWSIVMDSKKEIWIGTLQGVCRFDGKVFTPFDLPETAPDPMRGVTSAKIVHSIMEDSKGNMWFSTNGGAYIYDGESLSQLSEKDGLCHNSVNCILEDKDGNIWFATHHNGVCRWDGKSFTHFTTKDGVNGTEAWDIYEDRSGNIWFPIENSGVYCYDGKSFTNFQEAQGLATNAIQCTFEDKEGRLWLGGWKGLFRYDGSAIFSVGKNGPWQ